MYSGKGNNKSIGENCSWRVRQAGDSLGARSVPMGASKAGPGSPSYLVTPARSRTAGMGTAGSPSSRHLAPLWGWEHDRPSACRLGSSFSPSPL